MTADARERVPFNLSLAALGCLLVCLVGMKAIASFESTLEWGVNACALVGAPLAVMAFVSSWRNPNRPALVLSGVVVSLWAVVWMFVVAVRFATK